MRRMGVSVVLAGALLLGSAPAGAANREQQQIMAELRMLQLDQQQLRQLLLALNDAIKALNGRLDEQASTTRKALADQRLLVEGMTDNVRILRERADDTNVRLGSITQEIEALRQALASLSQQVPTPAADGSADPDGGLPVAGDPSAAPPPGLSPQRTYDSAWSDYTAGRFDLAVEGFETFLRFFPRHILADDAQLRIGDSLYNAGRFAEAVNAFQRVVGDYPGSDSVPQAYYKLGLTYMELKQPDLARNALETLMKEHPSSREYFLARQAIERLPKR